MPKKRWISLLVFLSICLGVEFLALYLTDTTPHTWFPFLPEPNEKYPVWIYGIFWTLLYLLVAASGWLIYNEKGHPLRITALILYGIQIFLNDFWSALFEDLKSPFLSIIDLFFLWLMTGVVIAVFYRINRLAAYLMVPYLLCTTYSLITAFR